jgi:hypothetical protein
MSARRRCAKRVFSGDRADMGGHMCGHYAKEGSEFCHIHGPKPPEADPSRDAERPPLVTSSQRRTYYATLIWEPESGPVVKLPYRSVHGFITKIQVKVTDDEKRGDYNVVVLGVVRKKDGTAGAQRWDASLHAAELIPERWLAVLDAKLAEERAQ